MIKEDQGPEAVVEICLDNPMEGFSLRTTSVSVAAGALKETDPMLPDRALDVFI